MKRINFILLIVIHAYFSVNSVSSDMTPSCPTCSIAEQLETSSDLTFQNVNESENVQKVLLRQKKQVFLPPNFDQIMRDFGIEDLVTAAASRVGITARNVGVFYGRTTADVAVYVYKNCLNGEIIGISATASGTGAALGGAVGTLVPVVGTSAGIIVGGILGGVGGAATTCATKLIN